MPKALVRRAKAVSGAQPRRVLQYKQMSNTLTVRVPQDLADWLDETSRKCGVSRSVIIRRELERARESSDKPFLHLIGAIKGKSSDLSMRKGYSRR